MLHVIRLVCLGAMLGSIACDNPANPLRNISVTVSVSSSVIRLNETTQITTTFENVGWRDAYVPSKSCGPLFAIVNAQGERLDLGPEICSLDLPAALRLAPGDRAQFTGTWDGRDRYGTRTPGDYRIVANAGGSGAVVRVLD
jgi:hypothetical protein